MTKYVITKITYTEHQENCEEGLTFSNHNNNEIKDGTKIETVPPTTAGENHGNYTKKIIHNQKEMILTRITVYPLDQKKIKKMRRWSPKTRDPR